MARSSCSALSGLLGSHSIEVRLMLGLQSGISESTRINEHQCEERCGRRLGRTSAAICKSTTKGKTACVQRGSSQKQIHFKKVQVLRPVPLPAPEVDMITKLELPDVPGVNKNEVFVVPKKRTGSAKEGPGVEDLNFLFEYSHVRASGNHVTLNATFCYILNQQTLNMLKAMWPTEITPSIQNVVHL
jgi:hypothetical protein